MKTLNMEVRKRDAQTGEMNVRVCDLSSLTDMLTPNEIFLMELRLNEILSIRVHLSLDDDMTLCDMGKTNAR